MKLSSLSTPFIRSTSSTLSYFFKSKSQNQKLLLFYQFFLEVSDIFQNSIQKRKPFILEYEISKKNGARIWVWERALIIRDNDDNVTGIEGFIMDITKRKEDEFKLIQLSEEKLAMIAKTRNQQKLESIGVLAGGVAHEINNPLNGILNYGQLIVDIEGIDIQAKEYATEIIYETNRASMIVRNLLHF